MFLNFIVNLFLKKNHQEQTKFASKLSVKTQKMSAIRDFSRSERRVLGVCIKPNNNQLSTK